MPKIFNTSWLAVLLATVVFFALGSIWYGPLFGDVWMEGARMTEEMAIASMEQKGAMMWVGALSLTLGQAIGVLMVIHLAGAKRLPACLKTAFWLVVTIALPILAYASVWQTVPLSGFLVDAGHMLVGYLLMAGIYALFRGKDAVDA